MTDLTKLKELAERALLFAPGDWFVENGIDQVRDAENDFVCETGEDEPIKAEYIAAANPTTILALITEVERSAPAVLTLEALGYTYHGGEMWKPPIGKVPDFDLIDSLRDEVERLRNFEARQQEITEHYKKWFKEIVYESFDEWLKDDSTHWIGEEDAALQAWQYLHENKIWLMKERIEEHEQERDRLKAENEELRTALRAVHAEVDGNIRPLTRDLVNMVSGVKNGSHPNDIYDHCEEIDRIIDAALEGGGR